MQQRHTVQGHIADDFALDQFLSLLIKFRVILLQDAAVLYTKHPTLVLFNFHPFNTPIFCEWAETLLTIISNAEAAARHQFLSPPDHYASSLCRMMTTINIEQQCEHLAHSKQYKTLSTQIESLTSMVTMDILPKGPRGQGWRSLNVTATCEFLALSHAAPHSFEQSLQLVQIH